MHRIARISNHFVSSSSNNNSNNISTASCAANENKSFKLLEGQVAIITGSGQGIGAEAARLFALHGAKVVVTDIDAQKSEAVTNEIIKQGGQAISVPGDVTAKEFPDKIVKATIDKFGKINCIVNNAGYTWDGVLHKISDEQWDAMLKVHNTAPFQLIRAAAPYMRDAAKAEIDAGRTPEPRSIINVSSTSGLHGNFGQANYSTAKMGVVGFTKTVAKEWGPFGIRCNAVAFGLIATRLTQAKEKGAFMQVGEKKVLLGIPKGSADATDPATRAKEKAALAAIPLQRTGEPIDAAGALLFLASPLSSYVTGHCLECTGGAGI